MNWPYLLLVPIIVIYLLLMIILSVYVLNYLYLAFVGLKYRRALRPPLRVDPVPWPRVTVQLPIFNELYVAARLLAAAAALDYPSDLLEIQVLDDSTDETVALVAAEVARQRLRGIDIVHLHRDEQRGFKAGALADGLVVAKGEFIAVFDADFLPAPDFLRRMMPRFDHPRVAFVQARWGHLNRDYSVLTFLQSLSLDAHFAIDQLARSGAGHFFNFNGTAGIWRKAAILDAGGWQADTLTEDLDLSYRVFLRGWTARFAGDVEAAAELPVSFTAFRRQQHRWARGSMECAIRFLPQIWRLDAPLARKLTATLHLTAYLTHFLTLGLIVLFPLLLALSRYYPRLLDPVGIGLFANLMFFVPALYFIIGQHLLGRRWLLRLPLIFIMTVLASGMMLNTLSAALQILRRKVIPFERTPKYGILGRGQDWRANRYRVEIDSVVLFELAFAALTLWTAVSAGHTSHWLIMTYSAFFSFGLLFASGFTLAQTLSQRFVPGPSA
jgi:cellulose synthase/poly-beta-1,6-N-acetylglucosamine synthase-like glycosyltransferase